MFASHHVRPDPGAPRVVLLHGVFADHHLWDAVLPHLDGLDVTALDGPGHGSARRTQPLPPLAEQVDALAAELDGPAVLAGHSWGGMLALRLAVRRPDLVSGLLLANTPLLRSSRAGFLAQRALLAAGLPAATYGRMAARALYGSAFRKRHPGTAAATGRATAALGRRGLIEVIDRVLLEPGDAVDLLHGLPMPVALVAGEADYVGSAPVRARVAATGHELRSHPGGHMGPAEAPEQLARLLSTLAARASTEP